MSFHRTIRERTQNHVRAQSRFWQGFCNSISPQRNILSNFPLSLDLRRNSDKKDDIIESQGQKLLGPRCCTQKRSRSRDKNTDFWASIFERAFLTDESKNYRRGWKWCEEKRNYNGRLALKKMGGLIHLAVLSSLVSLAIMVENWEKGLSFFSVQLASTACVAVRREYFL